MRRLLRILPALLLVGAGLDRDALNAKADPLDLNISAASEVTILPAIAGG